MPDVVAHHLLTLRIRGSRDVARLRDKVMQLGRACGFPAVDTTRLATAASDIARYVVDLDDEPISTRLGLVGVTGDRGSTAGIRLTVLRGDVADNDSASDSVDSISTGDAPADETTIEPDLPWQRWRGPIPAALQAAASLVDDLAMDPDESGKPARIAAVRWVTGSDLAGLVQRVRQVRDRLFEDTADDYLENLKAKQQQLERMLRQSVEANERLAQANQELERANAVKNRFLGVAAHDLRNPLHNILMATDVIGMPETSSEERTEVAAMIAQSAEGMLRLINDLLDVSRIESGVLAIAPSEVNLANYIRSLVEPMREIALRKKIEIRFELDEAPPSTSLDPDRIGQVISNLVDNAIKYSPVGTTVVVRAGLAPSVSGWQLDVMDEGPGIPAADMPHLFEAFHRGQNRPTAGEPSTGLGLAICRMLIRAHGGTISVANRSEGGSCFTVRLPAAPVQSSASGL